jgi:hypothetical protein
LIPLFGGDAAVIALNLMGNIRIAVDERVWRNLSRILREPFKARFSYHQGFCPANCLIVVEQHSQNGINS